LIPGTVRHIELLVSATPDDVLALVFFARVVEAQSFTGAAAKLGVSKSVVSARISQLEERLGTRLLLRTTRRLSLTADGLALYERAQRVVTEADEATSVAAGAATEPRGVLRVNAPPTLAELYLTAPIATYLERYPGARVELLLADHFIDLVEEGVDVAVRVSSRLRDSSLVGRKLAEDRTVVCAAPSYLERKGVPQSPAELLHHDCVRYTVLKTADEWRFREGDRSFSVPVEARFSAASGIAVREAAIAGIGLAVLPYFHVAADLRASRLVTVLDEYSYIRLTLHAVYSPARVLPINVRSFVDLLAAHFKNPPWNHLSDRELKTSSAPSAEPKPTLTQRSPRKR
jgi:DNA-binding transcriptional LysR family regulator